MRIFRVCVVLPAGNRIFQIRALTSEQARIQANAKYAALPGPYRTPDRILVTDISNTPVG